MDSDQATVRRFAELLQCPEDVARFCLDASGGNFDAAISMFYGKRVVLLCPCQTGTCYADGVAVWGSAWQLVCRGPGCSH